MNRASFRVGCLIVLLTVCNWVGLPALTNAKTQLLPGGIQEVDAETLKELLLTFEKGEQAMQARDLDAIMALYSDDYTYHGLKKADVRKIWNQLFEHYKQLESFHTFSVVRMVGTGGRRRVHGCRDRRARRRRRTCLRQRGAPQRPDPEAARRVAPHEADGSGPAGRHRSRLASCPAVGWPEGNATVDG